MPIISSLSAGVRSFGLYVLAALVSVIDTFNRTDNASDLGSISGQKWKIWRGIWGISGNKAVSSTTASTYPLATLTFTKTDVTVSISGQDPGMGTAFWVTDAENWYATTYVQTETCQTCSNCNSWNASTCNSWNTATCISWTCNSAFCSGGWNTSTCNAWNTSTCNGWTCNQGFLRCDGTYNPSNCNSWNPSNCKSWSLGNCVAWNNTAPKGYCASRNPSTCSGGYNTSTCNFWNVGNCNKVTFVCQVSNCSGGWNTSNCSGTWNASNCKSWFCNQASCSGGFNPSNCSGNFNPSTCNAFFSFSCNCVVEDKINILSFIAGSISTIVTYLYSSTVQSFKSILSGNSVTISAYSDTNWTTQIGSSNNQSITSPVKTKRHGIIKSTSSYGQGNSINEIRVD